MDKYKKMQENGAAAANVYKELISDGVTVIDRIRVIRNLYGLDLVAAKQLDAQIAHGASDLAEYQERLVESVETALSEEKREEQ